MFLLPTKVESKVGMTAHHPDDEEGSPGLVVRIPTGDRLAVYGFIFAIISSSVAMWWNTKLDIHDHDARLKQHEIDNERRERQTNEAIQAIKDGMKDLRQDLKDVVKEVSQFRNEWKPAVPKG